MQPEELISNRDSRKEALSEGPYPDEAIISPANYLDVPTPESNTSIRLIAARWTCDLLHAEDIPIVAADLLEAGIDSPMVRRLAAETKPSCRSDIEDLMVRFFQEFDLIDLREIRAAKLYLSRHIAREIISGKRDLWGGSWDFECLWPTISASDDIANALHLLSDVIFDYEAQRFRPPITQDLVDTFARIARMSDLDIFG